MSTSNNNEQFYSTTVDLLQWVVDKFLNGKERFTIRDALHEAAAALGDINDDQRRCLYNLFYRRFSVFVKAGCLETTTNPQPLPYEYGLSPDAAALVRQSAENNYESTVADLISYYNIKEFARLPKPITAPRHKFRTAEKVAGSTDTANTMRQHSPIQYKSQNGDVFYFDRPEDAARFAKSLVDEPETENEKAEEAVEPLSMNVTISQVVFDFAIAYGRTLTKLFRAAQSNDKKVSARFLSVALAQADKIIAGFKYDISHNVCVATDDLPCNADDCNAITLPDDYCDTIAPYIADLRKAAERAAFINDDESIVLPTLHAEGAKIPGTFRSSPNKVQWDFRGEPLPSHLQRKLEEQRQSASE